MVFLYLFNLCLCLRIYLLHTLTIKADFHKPAYTKKKIIHYYIYKLKRTLSVVIPVEYYSTLWKHLIYTF